jgi:hemoglobin
LSDHLDLMAQIPPNTPSHACRDQPQPSLYERFGEAPFADLACGLYARIDVDERIRALFPADLSANSMPVQDMREFLVQFFGGPMAYSNRKGHPRLRARHMRFPIGQFERDAWLSNALAALEEVATLHGLDSDAQREVREYLVRTSQFMMNRNDASQ